MGRRDQPRNSSPVEMERKKKVAQGQQLIDKFVDVDMCILELDPKSLLWALVKPEGGDDVIVPSRTERARSHTYRAVAKGAGVERNYCSVQAAAAIVNAAALAALSPRGKGREREREKKRVYGLG